MVEIDQVANAGQRDLRADERRGGSGCVALLTGHFHQARNRVAHKPHHVRERVARCVQTLGGRASCKLHCSCGCHCRRRPDLRLAASLCARYRCVARDQVSDGRRGRYAARQVFIGEAPGILQGKQHAGQHARRARRGGGYDAAHGRVRFQYGHSVGHGGGKLVVAERFAAGAQIGQLARFAAKETSHRGQRFANGLRCGALHNGKSQVKIAF